MSRHFLILCRSALRAALCFALVAMGLIGCAVGGTELMPVPNDEPDMGNPMPDLGPPPEDMGGPEDMGQPDMGPPDMGPPDLGPPDMGPCGGATPCCGNNIVESPEMCEPAAAPPDRCPVNPGADCPPATPCILGLASNCTARCVVNDGNPALDCP